MLIPSEVGHGVPLALLSRTLSLLSCKSYKYEMQGCVISDVGSNNGVEGRDPKGRPTREQTEVRHGLGTWRFEWPEVAAVSESVRDEKGNSPQSCADSGGARECQGRYRRTRMGRYVMTD